MVKVALPVPVLPFNFSDLLIEAEKQANDLSFACTVRDDRLAEYTDPFRRTVRVELVDEKRKPTIRITCLRERYAYPSADVPVSQANSRSMTLALISQGLVSLRQTEHL